MSHAMRLLVLEDFQLVVGTAADHVLAQRPVYGEDLVFVSRHVVEWRFRAPHVPQLHERIVRARNELVVRVGSPVDGRHPARMRRVATLDDGAILGPRVPEANVPVRGGRHNLSVQPRIGDAQEGLGARQLRLHSAEFHVPDAECVVHGAGGHLSLVGPLDTCDGLVVAREGEHGHSRLRLAVHRLLLLPAALFGAVLPVVRVCGVGVR
uniref:Putative secreted protein n=1 Tax=Ixodes ricinus TaxID=34613 RepID=A0A6B0V2D3_IXORI